MRQLILVILTFMLSLPLQAEVQSTALSAMQDEVVSRRMERSRTAQIGESNFVTEVHLQPINYKVGKDYLPINTEVKTKAFPYLYTYEKIADCGRFVAEFDDDKGGAFKFSRKGVSIEFIPSFAGNSAIGIKQVVTTTGIKSTYTLSQTAPSRLAWEIKHNGALSQVGEDWHLKSGENLCAVIKPPIAWDDFSEPVSVSVTFKADSLIYLVDVSGAKYPITVDPTIQDTVVVAKCGAHKYADATWTTSRNAPIAESTNTGYIQAVNQLTSSFFVNRTPIPFDLSSYDAASVDSARLYIYLQSGPGSAAYDTILFVEGTYSGALATNQFNDFTGWAGSGTYNVVEWTDRWIGNNVTPENTWYSLLFNATGRSAIESALNSGTFSLFTLGNTDVKNIEPSGSGEFIQCDGGIGSDPAYIKIYTSAAGINIIVDTKDGAVDLTSVDGVGVADINKIDGKP